MGLLIFAFVVWSVLHSLTAALFFKAWVRRQVGEQAYEGGYRLAYNGVAAVTFVPILYLLAIYAPRQLLWAIPRPWNLLAMAIQLIGAAGVVVSLAQSDFWLFAGVEQAIAYWQGKAEPERPSHLRTDGVYRLVRHPLYFFSLLFLWFAPVMTLGLFLFNLVATLYFMVGSLLEERRLEAYFGDSYRAYRRRVPWLLPLWKVRN